MLPTTSILFALLFFVNFIHVPVLALSIPERSLDSNGGPVQCKELLQRREWRTLSTTEKKDYIDAVKCLQSLPAHDPIIKEAQSRFEEFQAYHIYIADQVHVMGQFLPWHRHFVRIYELALRSECGYKGANPYWDWSQDADEFAGLHSSPVFDPITGFGGNGVPGTYTVPADPKNTSRIYPDSFLGCVQDGPFANLTLHLGPGLFITDHCLTRGINDTTRIYLNSAAVAQTTALPTFEEFRIELEGEPVTIDHKLHDGGHAGIGGDMSNFYSSPAEPLFYLHHANLDRIWWNWQQMLPSRLHEISGRSTLVPPFHNVTLDFTLQMGASLGPEVPIRDVMDIHSKNLCYTYV